MGIAAKTLKNITLETGGKSPLLVFGDADLDEAAKWSHLGIMSNQGQIVSNFLDSFWPNPAVVWRVPFSSVPTRSRF